MTRVMVTAVFARMPYVEYLQSHIPDLEIVWDKERNAMETFLRATRLSGDDPIIRLEEDICLTVGWREKIEALIAARPDEVIQCFSRSKYDPSLGSRYKAGSSYIYNVCNYLPAGVSSGIVKHYETWADKEKYPTGNDYLIADYLRANHLQYWLEVPSLVNHAVTISQINRKRARSRQSTTFINPELTNFPEVRI
jgi:hypothetical protein